MAGFYILNYIFMKDAYAPIVHLYRILNLSSLIQAAALLVPGIVSLFGVGIISMIIGYSFLRRPAWKSAIILASFYLLIGIILLIGLITIQSKEVRVEILLLYITSIIMIIGGLLLILLLVRKSLNSNRENTRVIWLNIVIIASIFILTFYYINTAGLFDKSINYIVREGEVNDGLEIMITDLGTCGTNFVFVPDGRIFCADLWSGKVMEIENWNLNTKPLIELDVETDREMGLIGIAIDPKFEENHYVYLYWTYRNIEDGQIYKRVARFTEINSSLTNEKILLDKIPASPIHNGGPLEFGPDEKLYITGGDASINVTLYNKALVAQDLNSHAGKIFRINSDGTIPEDNPFPGLPYYTIGHRNVFGIGFHPVTSTVYVTENGPPNCCDELNALIAGGNYGWPFIAGDNIPVYVPLDNLVSINYLTNKERFRQPILTIEYPSEAPTELIFYTGDKYNHMNNNLFFTTWKTKTIYRVVLEEPEYTHIVSIDKYTLPISESGLLDIEQGPDGYLYVSTFSSIIRLKPQIFD